MEDLKLLITVKTYPIPSAKYEELVCTAGVTETGDFVRLYPINFRDLPFSQQYRKYQWIRVRAQKHAGRDARKESYRPDCSTLQVLGEPIPTGGDWSERARYALARQARSMEDLYDRQERDRTSLGVVRPRAITDLRITEDTPEWKPAFRQALLQTRIWEGPVSKKRPPRKVPFKFHYSFQCDDQRCKANHQMMIEDWEVGALYWRLVDKGGKPADAAEKVRDKFLKELCGPSVDPHFFVGTILAHPKKWVVLGVFSPKKEATNRPKDRTLPLFPENCG